MDPRIMVGKPTIKGTRITVELILRKLGAGMTPEEIIADHPHLSPDDIRAAQAFAADYLADEAVLDQRSVRLRPLRLPMDSETEQCRGATGDPHQSRSTSSIL